jgi:predicted XRE-type DNA-binding protein
MKRPPVTKGSGNIFRDLGFSQERAAELILKSSLLQARQDTLRAHAWTQTGAAAHLGIDQGKVSKLLAGQMAGFSVERLVHFLSLLGQDVEVTVCTGIVTETARPACQSVRWLPDCRSLVNP